MESARLGICYSEIAATVKRNHEKGLEVLIPFTSHLLCAQHSLRHFTYIPSFYAHNITV